MSVFVAMLVAAADPAAAGAVHTSSHAESATSNQSVHEVIVAAPPASVWAAVSTAEGWRGWAATRAWASAGEPQVIETTYDPRGAPWAAANIKSQVVLRMPDRPFAFRTIKAPAGFTDADVLTAITWLIELEPTADGTRVRLTGSGYPRSPAGDRILAFFMSHNPVALRALHDRYSSAGAISTKH